MEHKIIAIYCLIEYWLKLMRIKDDVRAKASNAEILFAAYISVSDFNGNYKKAYEYSKKYVKLPEYSRFVRRVSKLENII